MDISQTSLYSYQWTLNRPTSDFQKITQFGKRHMSRNKVIRNKKK